MGQTLTHGVYLPDEGERNCYSGLAANWQLLDGAVGTVAEHTSQIAGKAPLVHTHTKANITDLLNSNFIPSANNSYDLGSASKQWLNTYSKGYYYNGVAWGLDKENEWTKTQDFVGENQGNEFSANYRTCFAMYGRFDTVGKSGMFFTKFRPYKAQGSLDSSDVIQYGVDVLENEVRTNNVFDLQASGYDSNTGKFTKIDVVSGLSNANLGTSTNKWKTLNGTNPGALSLPSNSYETINNKIYNPNGQLNAIDLNGGANYWTSDCDCYIYFFINNNKFSWIKIYWPNSNVCLGQTYIPVPNDTSAYSGYIPVPANTKVIIMIQGTAVPSFRRVTCQGNV